MIDKELIEHLIMSLDPADNARARWLIYLNRASWSTSRPDRIPGHGLDPRFFHQRRRDESEEDDMDNTSEAS